MKINFKRLDHVQLCVPPGAEGQAREFYGILLGLAEIEKPEPLQGRGGLWFQIATFNCTSASKPTTAARNDIPRLKSKTSKRSGSILRRTACERATRFRSQASGVSPSSIPSTIASSF
jgi:hypothetical protein